MSFWSLNMKMIETNLKWLILFLFAMIYKSNLLNCYEVFKVTVWQPKLGNMGPLNHVDIESRSYT